MSEPTATKRITDDLDEVLRRYTAADKGRRSIDRELRRANDLCDSLDEEARRLRLALFALEGAYNKTAGDANKANSLRRGELTGDPA